MSSSKRLENDDRRRTLRRVALVDRAPTHLPRKSTSPADLDPHTLDTRSTVSATTPARLEPVTNAFDDPPPEHIAVECGQCKATVSAPVTGKVHKYDDDAEMAFEVLLMSCPACHSAIVAGRTIERWGDYDEVDISPARRLWPLPTRELSFDAPAGTRRDFDEAQRCMSVSAHTAAAILARRLLEGIAVDLGAKGGTLAAKLASLKDAGAIDGRLAEWADALRVVGNDAAHRTDTVISHEDAADALSFAEALSDYVYTFRARYDRFLARRSAPPPKEAEPL